MKFYKTRSIKCQCCPACTDHLQTKWVDDDMTWLMWPLFQGWDASSPHPPSPITVGDVLRCAGGLHATLSCHRVRREHGCHMWTDGQDITDALAMCNTQIEKVQTNANLSLRSHACWSRPACDLAFVDTWTARHRWIAASGLVPWERDWPALTAAY